MVHQHDFHDLAIKLQKNIKKWLFSSKFQKIREAAIKIQKTWKMHKQQEHYKSQIKKIIKIQSYYRGNRVRKLYNFLLSNKLNNFCI